MIDELKQKALGKICNELEVVITTVNPDGRSLDHTFYKHSEAIEFIDEFYRTAYCEEEIYIAE
jgi:hypothetical protein